MLDGLALTVLFQNHFKTSIRKRFRKCPPACRVATMAAALAAISRQSSYKSRQNLPKEPTRSPPKQRVCRRSSSKKSSFLDLSASRSARWVNVQQRREQNRL